MSKSQRQRKCSSKFSYYLPIWASISPISETSIPTFYFCLVGKRFSFFDNRKVFFKPIFIFLFLFDRLNLEKSDPPPPPKKKKTKIEEKDRVGSENFPTTPHYHPIY